MQKLSIKQEFECDLAMLLRAREERYKRLDKFPELKNVEIVSEEEVDGRLKQVRRISIADSMPAVLTALLPSGADTLHEESLFDPRENLHTFAITPGGGLDHIFRITGQSTYYSLSENRSARSYEVEIKSKALLVGGAVEAAIAGVYRQSLEKDEKSIRDFIKMLQEENS